jgi:hypothetical protein
MSLVSRDGARAVLTVGFVALTGAILVAHWAPAREYEVSMYWATPALVWLLLGVAMLVALWTTASFYDTREGDLALLLGGAAVSTVLALPLIRGYRFLGQADPLTHLGYVNALLADTTEYIHILYPGSHVFSVFQSVLAGIPPTRAMLFVQFALAVAFIMFVPLCVRAIVNDPRAVAVGAFSGFFLLPINNVALLYRFHPFSMTTLFFPLFLYLLLLHMSHASEDHTLPWNLSATSLALPLAGVAILFYHPQVLLDVIILLGGLAALQYVVRQFEIAGLANYYRPVYAHVVILFVAFLIWGSAHDETGRAAGLVYNAVETMLSGGGAVENVQRQANSANEIGVSILELFVKLFFVSAIYVFAAVSLVGKKVFDLLGAAVPDRDGVIVYFAAGGMALAPFVLIHSWGKANSYLFRHIGFGMVIVTILGALAIFYSLTWIGARFESRGGKSALVSIAFVLLVLSSAIIFSSPFVHLPGQHMSDQQYEGYERSFDIQPDDYAVWFGGIRQVSNRYKDAFYAAPDRPWEPLSTMTVSSGPVTDANLTDLRTYYETHFEPIVRRDHYFVVSRLDRQREFVAYNELRYSPENVSSIPVQRGVHTVYSNGNFDLYYVDTHGDPLTADAREEEEKDA